MKILCRFLLCAVLAIAPWVLVCAENLVILHTNDTHSAIDPAGDGTGGALQRKAIIDSVRKAEKNVILIDAGDAVQGSLYFKFFRGDVEQSLMNMMGYDVQILGNHEFDNGMEELKRMYSKANASRLSANYDFSDTPLDGMFDPYVIRKIGKRKIGIIGLNIDPSSLISASNCEGLEYEDVIETANETAEYLKEEKGCDLIVCVTHIGALKENEKPTDYELARASKDIDIIIGGHSHTVIQPGSTEGLTPAIVDNAVGRPVLVAQTGKYGKYLGYIKIDLDALARQTPADFRNELIPVTDRFPEERLDKRMKDFLAPFRERIDEAHRHIVGRSSAPMNSNARTGRYANWVGDFAKWYADLKTDSLERMGEGIGHVDFAMMNVGGIRHDMPEGNVSEGLLLETFPFPNHFVIARIKGKDFIEAMRLAAKKGGEGVSDDIRVVKDADGNLIRVIVDDREMDPEKEYLMATIDYLQWGNDDFTSLAKSELEWREENELSEQILRYVRTLTELGLPIDGDPRPRFVSVD